MEIKKTLTVFTPTFNRAYSLPLGYEALKRQTCKDFKWLIIDDGSTDNTRELVQSWIEEGLVEIQYFYKENGGMHTAHNAAYKLIDTELNVCVDSDDFMTDDAVLLILNKWKSVSQNPKLAGIVGLDAFKDGSIVGTRIPNHLHFGTIDELYEGHKVVGDKKVVLRTDYLIKYPQYPVFDNERLVPLGVLYTMIGRDFDFAYDNSIYCIVEYLNDGSTKNIFKQYKQSPRGFAYARIWSIKYNTSLRKIIKSYIHLVSSALFAKDLTLIFKNTNVLLSILFFPIGVIFNLYVRYRILK